CYICPKRPSFNTNQALKYHSQASINHSPWPYCKPCSRLFIYQSALDTIPDATQFHCCNCDRDFSSESSLDQHLRDKVHAERPTALLGFFCRPCNRTFKDEYALKQHMSSLKHNPLIEELKCITDSKCKKTFMAPSAMLHHLESGACISGINRQKLDHLIKEKDTGSIITFQAGLEGRIHSDDDDDDSSDSEEVLAFVEGDQKCPMCPAGSTRTFKTAHALWQHMNSAAHAPLSYHCPLRLAVGGKGIMKSFTTLSGMTQHLESGAC
ncbi:hypothetical protein P167DRAFT_475025, partial [Morchella conica CCBAS932]